MNMKEIYGVGEEMHEALSKLTSVIIDPKSSREDFCSASADLLMAQRKEQIDEHILDTAYQMMRQIEKLI